MKKLNVQNIDDLLIQFTQVDNVGWQNGRLAVEKNKNIITQTLSHSTIVSTEKKKKKKKKHTKNKSKRLTTHNSTLNTKYDCPIFLWKQNAKKKLHNVQILAWTYSDSVNLMFIFFHSL